MCDLAKNGCDLAKNGCNLAKNVCDLVEVGKGVKETSVNMEWGGIMDIIGLTSVLVGVLSSCAMTYGRREKQIKL